MKRLRRVLLVVLGVMAFAGTAASAATADSWFNPDNLTGFIARGDVINYVGKDGLVMPTPLAFPPTPFVIFDGIRDVTVTCTYSDGSTVTVTKTHQLIENAEMAPTARVAPGSGTITGYFLPGALIDFTSFDQPALTYCEPKDGMDPVSATKVLGPWIDPALVFIADGLSGRIPVTIIQ
jgi:hypothetical protein